VFEVELPGYPARIERVAIIEVAAFDWNCPQHITPRFTAAELAARPG
jgi:predicted pyridoxine 5'-phosphate oxidase superfamily flavin-nucleotide-binding protein